MNLIQEYNRYYSSDGYNTTLKLLLQVALTSYFTVQNGIKELNLYLKIQQQHQISYHQKIQRRFD
jgi:hypothetical protein